MVPGRPEVSPSSLLGRRESHLLGRPAASRFHGGPRNGWMGPGSGVPPARLSLLSLDCYLPFRRLRRRTDARYFFSSPLSPLRLPSLCLAVDSAPLSFASLFSSPRLVIEREVLQLSDSLSFPLSRSPPPQSLPYCQISNRGRRGWRRRRWLCGLPREADNDMIEA